MNIAGFLKSRRGNWKVRRAESRLLRRFTGIADEISESQWEESLANPTEFYQHCFHYFHTRLPKSLREHRAYFESNGRGFGERSFHVMWFLLFRKFAPENFLEIGVFRGQTLSLAAMLARHFKFDASMQGISPFSPAGDAVSKYRHDLNYYEDTLENFAHFSLPAPGLLQAYSTDRMAAELIASQEWSCIYIDGNHDYEIARRDWDLCASNLRTGGLIVLDDSGLTTSYAPSPILSTAGHPGPSRLAKEVDRTHFREILQVGHNRVFQKTAL
ncbi:class I SAM-dependent methyltransferase [Granulicella sp. dw_53]|uniref:class I SAM-dependent methyltransferase n=1 Tax=Granulicella sp. dw_53 TaxID=2719792 RepID=UPI001BD3C488|nr:class I SAM-dependent methyltransferase [Granulicella sp. dw_53]